MLFIDIHGFNSSPQSFKAHCFADYLLKNHPSDELIAPQLSDLPGHAITSLSQMIEQHIKSGAIALIGSSLGGFYATWLAEKYDLKAVLVNPAVNPQELLLNYLGKNTNYHTGKEYEFTQQHIEQLQEFVLRDLKTPENLMVMLQTGDEVLDYLLAEKKYSKAHLLIESGGDHSFQNFARHCEKIHQFMS